MKYYKIYDNIGNDYIGKYTKSQFKETKYGLELLWEHLEKVPNHKEKNPTHICIN